MRDRVRQEARASVKRGSTRSHGVWAWLKQDETKRRFASWARLLPRRWRYSSALASFTNRRPRSLRKLRLSALPEQQSAAPSQSANASGGTAVNVQGSGNYVRTEKP